MPRHSTLADYYRAHREEMELAIATGCTPIEARAELRRRAKARRAACGTRAHEGAAESSHEHAPPASFGDWAASWMMRD